MAVTEIFVDNIGYVSTQSAVPYDVKLNYVAQVGIIDSILSKTPKETVTDADAVALLNALKGLNNLALGKQVNGAGAANPFYLTVEMARSIDAISRSFDAVGLDSNNATATNVLKWQDLNLFGLDSIMATAKAVGQFAPIDNTDRRIKSEQAYIELVYIKAGNDYIGTAMADLRNAIALTEDSIRQLTVLQNLHNYIDVNDKINGTLPPAEHVIGQLSPIFSERPVGADGKPMPLGSSKEDELRLLARFLGISDVDGFVTQFKNITEKGSSPYASLLAKVDTLFGTETERTFHNTVVIGAGGHTTTTDYTIKRQDMIDSINKALLGFSENEVKFFCGVTFDENVAPFGEPPHFETVVVANNNDLTNYSLLGIPFGVSPDYTFQTVPIPQWIDFKSTVDFSNNNGFNYLGAKATFDPGTLTTTVIEDTNQANFIGFASPIDPFVQLPIITEKNGTEHQVTIAEVADQLAKAKQLIGDLILKIGPGTLADNLQLVVNDMPTDTAGVTKWILDNLDQHNNTAATKAGFIQNNITKAITAAQSLNDSQGEDVRRILFIFDTFYESAGSFLDTITETIETIADNAA